MFHILKFYYSVPSDYIRAPEHLGKITLKALRTVYIARNLSLK